MSNGRLGDFCNYAEVALKSCKPKILCADGEVRPVLFFTDASWESGRGGLGVVLVDVAMHEAWVYSGEPPSSLRDAWVDELGDHIICQLELYTMVATMLDTFLTVASFGGWTMKLLATP